MGCDLLRGGWVQTFTGKQFFPLDPDPADVCVEDIAHHLSQTCRFVGACRKFYSVAQHSVYVAQLCGLTFRMHGLMHDAAEAYVGDISRPIKGRVHLVGANYDKDDMTVRAFRDVEDRILWAIYQGLHLGNVGHFSEVREADEVMLSTEARDLMAKPPKSWGALPAPLAMKISPWPAEQAEAEFLKLFNALR